MRAPIASRPSTPRSSSRAPPPPSSPTAWFPVGWAPPCPCSSSRSLPLSAATSWRVRSTSSIDSGLSSGSAGRKLSAAIGVSLSTNTSLMNPSAEKQATGSASPQRPCAKPARAPSQTRRVGALPPAAHRVHEMGLDIEDEVAPLQAAASGSSAASAGSRKRPAGLPRAAKAASRVESRLAAPHSPARKARRLRPTRRAFIGDALGGQPFCRATAGIDRYRRERRWRRHRA
jgi:hypothetical protein